MKVGILTFHRAHNYGAALQAYALTRHIRRLGYDAELIDFIPAGHTENVTYLHGPTSIGRIKKDLLYFTFRDYLKNREKSFTQFQEAIGLSNARGVKRNELPPVLESYDVVVCGSDQIWNPLLVDADIGFFTPAGTGFSRIAYGASLGGGKLQGYGQDQLIRSSLAKFDAISFREKGSLEKALSFLDLPDNCAVVADPTLLERKAAFDEVASVGATDREYIFVYSVTARGEVFKAAKLLSERTGLPCFTLFAGRPNRGWLTGIEMVPPGDVGPCGFLSLVRDATWCVTDSYHGTVLSALYGTKCLTVAKVDTNGNAIHDVRFEELAATYGSIGKSVLAEQVKTLDLDGIASDAEAFELIRDSRAEYSSEWLRGALGQIASD